jgi:DNA-binding transcriptional ArsR family regulator
MMPGAEHRDLSTILARLARHPLRQHVLFKYAEAVTSPRDIAAALDVRLNLVSYHTQKLLRAGLIELVGTERRRGATQHYYRATLEGDIEDEDWARLPAPVRRGLVRGTIEGALREAADALPRGGMDAPTSHVSRSYFVLDRQGQEELASLLRSSLEAVRVIEAASSARAGDDADAQELVIISFNRASRP